MEKLEDIFTVYEEPEHSHNELLKYKQKYNISDEDFKRILFEHQIYLIAKKEIG